MLSRLTNADKTGIIHAIVGALVAAYAYLKGIDFDISLIDWQIAGEWVIGLGALAGYSNRRNRMIPDNTYGNIAPSDQSQLPQGLRLNNPGNLRPDNRYQWQGQIGVVSGKHGPFVQFDSFDNGLRAMAKNLKNQYRLHKLNTIGAIIDKWAPGGDGNDPQGYAAYVAEHSGYNVDQVINMTDDSVIVKLLKPMIRMENGQQPFSAETLLKAAAAA